MKSRWSFHHWLSVLAVAVGVSIPVVADEKPLGASDFRPSRERPVGWRGDGSGVFPGATPPTSWCEEKEQVCSKRDPGSTGDATSGVIRWRTELPSYGHSSPVVVGGKVFVTADPDRLICVDADSGEIIWQKRTDYFQLLGLEGEALTKARKLYRIKRALHFIGYRSKRTGELTRRRFRELAEQAGQIEPSLKGQIRMDAADRTIKDGAAFDRHMQKAYGQAFDRHWADFIDYAFPTPVSDGRHVYVALGFGQVACYDLEGERIWAKAFRFDPSKSDADARLVYIASPVMAAKLLVVKHGHAVCAFHPDTGEVAWERQWSPDEGYGYQCGTPVGMTLGDGEDSVEVLVFDNGWILRARDGELLGELPVSSRFGHSPCVDDRRNIVFTNNVVDKVRKLEAYRLQPDGNEVLGERLWSTKGLVSPTYHRGLLYGHNGGGYATVGRPKDALIVLDANSGEVVRVVKGMDQSYNDLAIAGDHIFTWRGSLSRRGKTAQGGTATLGREAELVAISQLSYHKPRSGWMERDLPKLYAQSSRGESRFFGFAGMFFSGDRIFIRSTSHLYCIVPRPTNPRSPSEASEDKGENP